MHYIVIHIILRPKTMSFRLVLRPSTRVVHGIRLCFTINMEIKIRLL